MSNTMVAVNMKIVVCIEGCLFLLFGFYASLVSVYEGVDIVLADFHTLSVASTCRGFVNESSFFGIHN